MKDQKEYEHQAKRLAEEAAEEARLRAKRPRDYRPYNWIPEKPA